MRRLTQIGRARPSVQMRPQQLDHSITSKPTTVRKRKERHQLPRPPRWPIPLANLARSIHDAKAP
jgi:hypothetical protein